MSIAESADGAVSVGAQLDWTCRSASLSWQGDCQRADAAAIYVGIFGTPPTASQRNKFATASMPCRSWAQGLHEGVAIDLRFGIDDEHSRLQLTGPDAGHLGLTQAMSRLQSITRQLETAISAPITGRVAVLDLELSDPYAHRSFSRWLDHAEWQNRALVLRQEYVFELEQQSAEARLVASLDRREHVNRMDMILELKSRNRSALSSPDLFEAASVLLAAPRLADVISIN